MDREIEVKYRCNDPAAAQARLRVAAARPLGRWLVTDRYFDHDDGRLARNDAALRLRSQLDWPDGADKPTHAHAPAEAVLAFKGPRQPHPTLKIRGERQVAVGHAEAMADILSAAGLACRVVVEKRRASWMLGQCRIELDELPLIGAFVEVEGPGEACIAEACGLLGLAGEPIGKPYLHLLADHCRRRGLEFGEFRFEG